MAFGDDLADFSFLGHGILTIILTLCYKNANLLEIQINSSLAMKYIESPNLYIKQLGEMSVFLAGGITGCPDWQQEVTQLLQDNDLVVLNPRRKRFPIDDPEAAAGQIQWEYRHLRIADLILFWFPKESVCPIALYELGTWTMKDKPIHVGMHPDYQRRLDIEIQTQLRRPEIKIVFSSTELVNQLLDSICIPGKRRLDIV